ncbi:DUF2927 domain-containing protein [Rhodovulum strictum]|uniref:DUF2927 domain-containing protein n=1 Tax=Rhodovulum strictum TaxID=58314 RepID=A0A844BFX2_9RHOB|nr:DUF2927 domain-containing protein [Rhodovulum strictum]MRH20275.1 DUF2927 domain-containing protein [Rhodovulum strictum]
MRRVALALAACLALAGCAAPVSEMPGRAPSLSAGLPPMKSFPVRPADPPTRSNAQIAQDFLDLSFRMESGRPLAVMSRFEGPVRVRVTGNPPPSLGPDLAALISRLRREAGIDITRVAADQPAEITIEVMPRARLQRMVPQAACFVAPRVSGWEEYRRVRRSPEVDWTTLITRDRVAIFLPGDVSPQEVRDCLHEELAQALGPLNDMYRLPDSVFNDDNFHTVLTGFDMLILRLYYAPELRSGMTRAQVAQILPGLLARMNPRGEGRPGAPLAPTSRDWIEAIETALGAGTSAPRRRVAAERAVTIARARGWQDGRLAFSLFALGRLSLGEHPELALAAFLQAGEIYASRPETRIHLAHVGMHLAAFALSAGQPRAALDLANGNIAAATRGQNAALLATLLLIKAEALDALDRPGEARSIRQEALGWGRYGFGSDDEVRSRTEEIAALNRARRS